MTTRPGTPPIDLLPKANRIRTGARLSGRLRSFDGFFLTGLTDPTGEFAVHVDTMRGLAKRGCPLGEDVLHGVQSLRAIPIGLDLTQPLDAIFERTLFHHGSDEISIGNLQVAIEGVEYVFRTSSRTSQALISAGVELLLNADPSAAVPWLCIEDREVVRTEGTKVSIRVATIVLRE